MSKVVSKIKKGASSVARTVKGAVRGDIDDILNISTLGASKALETVGKKIHAPFKAPPIPDAPGISQANTQEAAPDVNLATTAESRRTSGAAYGTRKLRVPIGGLRDERR